MTNGTSDATNAATGGSPVFKAGSGNFLLKLTTSGVNGVASGYTGKASINNAAIVPVSPATVAGQVVPVAFPAATSASGASTASGSDFTYSEVGAVRIGSVSLSGLAVAAIVGILLNAVLPGKDYEFGIDEQGDTSVNFKV